MTLTEWLDDWEKGRHGSKVEKNEWIVHNDDLDRLIALARLAGETLNGRTGTDCNKTSWCDYCGWRSYEERPHGSTCPAAKYDRIAKEVESDE